MYSETSNLCLSKSTVCTLVLNALVNHFLNLYIFPIGLLYFDEISSPIPRAEVETITQFIKQEVVGLP